MPIKMLNNRFKYIPKYKFWGRYVLTIPFFLFYNSIIFAKNLTENVAQITHQPINKDFDFNPNLQKAYQDIIKFKIESARQLLSKENPNNGIKILLDDYIDMIYLLNNGSQEEYKKLVENEEERLDLIDNLDKTSPYSRFIRAEIKLHWVPIKYRFGNETKAAWNFIQANKLLKENVKLFPNFIPQQKSLGLIHIIIGSIPESYTWVTNLMGLRGNIQKGQEELNRAIKDTIFGTETQFYNFYLQSYLLSFDAKKSEQLLKFATTHPDYLSVSFLASAILMRDNKSNNALELIEKRPAGKEYLVMPIFNYLKGEIALQREEYSQAITHYLPFTKNFKNPIFQKDAALKLFYAYWLSNDQQKALFYLNKIPQVGNTLADADKAAQKFHENYTNKKQIPNKLLMKARFAFDGGFYDKAIRAIDGIKEKQVLNPKEQAEYYYRKGRIYHKVNKIEQAIIAYQQSIRLSENQEWSFGANSTLQLGYIYQELGYIEQSKIFFNRAIAYKKNENKNSIDIRAKAALRELSH
jgi:tetratricopeptide (TPR) repeat protein